MNVVVSTSEEQLSWRRIHILGLMATSWWCSTEWTLSGRFVQLQLTSTYEISHDCIEKQALFHGLSVFLTSADLATDACFFAISWNWPKLTLMQQVGAHLAPLCPELVSIEELQDRGLRSCFWGRSDLSNWELLSSDGGQWIVHQQHGFEWEGFLQRRLTLDWTSSWSGLWSVSQLVEHFRDARVRT